MVSCARCLGEKTCSFCLTRGLSWSRAVLGRLGTRRRNFRFSVRIFVRYCGRCCYWLDMPKLSCTRPGLLIEVRR